jgi:hypothetical protein
MRERMQLRPLRLDGILLGLLVARISHFGKNIAGFFVQRCTLAALFLAIPMKQIGEISNSKCLRSWEASPVFMTILLVFGEFSSIEGG